MTGEPLQCPYCGYLISAGPGSSTGDYGYLVPADPAHMPVGICQICCPDPVPDHVKREYEIGRWRRLVLEAGKDGAVVREARLWENTARIREKDIRPVLSRMEEDEEIERFGGYYRVLATRSDAAA